MRKEAWYWSEDDEYIHTQEEQYKKLESLRYEILEQAASEGLEIPEAPTSEDLNSLAFEMEYHYWAECEEEEENEEEEIRAAFWQSHPEHVKKAKYLQNDYEATCRTAFSFFVDSLAREGSISDKLARKVTL